MQSGAFGGLTPEELGRMIVGLDQESDRGFVLIAAATLDEVLRLMLRHYFIDNPHEKNFLDKLFENEAPLSTFSSRIRLAYALGFIGDDLYHDLQIVRDIRNKFAHSIKALQLDTDSIRDRIRNFRYAKSWFGHMSQTNDLRLNFKFNFAAMLLGLVAEAALEKKSDNRPEGLMELFEKHPSLKEYRELVASFVK